MKEKYQYVDLYPSGYKWVCPKCEDVNEILGLKEILECSCGVRAQVREVHNIEEV